MDQRAGWPVRFYDRVHAARIARWRRGELDDAGFERAQRAWARNVILVVFGGILLVAAGMDWFTQERTREDHLEHTLVLAGLLTLFGALTAFRFSRFARFGARDFLMRQLRAVAERNPALDLTSGPGAGQKPIAALADGSHQLSVAHANRVLLLAMLASLALGGVMAARPQLVWITPFLAAVLGHALYRRFDRRPFLEISPEGVWCRAWGTQRHPWSTFKAVYPRQNQLQRGVAFVPRSVAEFGRTLKWTARYSLRSGDGFPAHIGSLTLWATQVGLDRDRLLREIQARIVAAQPKTLPAS